MNRWFVKGYLVGRDTNQANISVAQRCQNTRMYRIFSRSIEMAICLYFMLIRFTFRYISYTQNMAPQLIIIGIICSQMHINCIVVALNEVKVTKCSI